MTQNLLTKDQLIPCFTVKKAVEQYLKLQERREKPQKNNEI